MRKKQLAMVMLAIFLPVACAVQAPTAPKSKAEDPAKVLSVPAKVEKKSWPSGSIQAIEKGTPSPAPGILLSEPRAKSLVKLRIAYDYLHTISTVNSLYSLKVIGILQTKLKAADAVIEDDRRRRNSWLERNKLALGIILGVVLTLGFGGLAVWGASELKK